MGNCESLSVSATKSISTGSGSVSNGSEEASFVYSDGIVTGSKISLSLECKGLPRMDLLSKSDPFVVVYVQGPNSTWNEVGRTEIVVNDEDPVFVTKIFMTYKFESIQRLLFQVYDADEDASVKTIKLERQDFIGEAISVLSEIVHKREATILPLKLDGSDRGTITVKCEEMSENTGEIVGRLVGKGLSSYCFYKLFNDDEKNGITPMYKSEVQKNCNWSDFCIDSSIFCNSDLNRPIILRVYQYKSNGNHIMMGEIKLSTNKLIAAVNTDIQLSGENAKGYITIQRFAFNSKPSFLKFVQNGLDLNFMVAIDFTGSNGKSTDPMSLHYANPSSFSRGILNQYEQAITTVGGVLEYYDTDRMFPTYGFGACLNNERNSNHCFALNGNEAAPDVYGVESIMQVYHNAVTSVRFSGPTLFEYVLEKAVGNAKEIQPEKNKYLILLIITDGAIHDMDETTRLIVEGADTPFSILIVGVGNDDFGNMNTLDGDEERLSYRGKVASRDIVQFVPLNKMQSQTPEAIAKALLEEIPGQVTDYMCSHGITPEIIASLRPFVVEPITQ